MLWNEGRRGLWKRGVQLRSTRAGPSSGVPTDTTQRHLIHPPIRHSAPPPVIPPSPSFHRPLIPMSLVSVSTPLPRPLVLSADVRLCSSVRATVLIETILAAFEMDEILYELRQHSAGLNCQADTSSYPLKRTSTKERRGQERRQSNSSSAPLERCAVGQSGRMGC